MGRSPEVTYARESTSGRRPTPEKDHEGMTERTSTQPTATVAVFEGPERISVRDVEIPVPGPPR